MSRSSRFALALSPLLLATACGGSSGGGGGTSDQAVVALRRELSAAGIQPLPDAPVVSDELFALGQALFFDKILSGNQDVACATCHLPQFATSDGRTLASGVGGIGLGPERGLGRNVQRHTT